MGTKTNFSASGLFLVVLTLVPTLTTQQNPPNVTAPTAAATAQPATPSAAPTTTTAAPPPTDPPTPATTPAPTPPPVTLRNTPSDPNIAMDVTKPLSILHGEYTLKDSDIEDYRPTWASIWKIEQKDIDNAMFEFVFWPPKYCHAIYVCPISNGMVPNQQNVFKTEQGYCEDSYIKLYPHAKKLLLKAASDSNEEQRFLMTNRIEFDIDEKRQATLHVLDSEPQNYDDWLEKWDERNGFNFDFTGNDLLVLTNSRMCQVVKGGSKFFPFFQGAIQSDTSGKFPEWLNDGDKYVQSDALPPIFKSPHGKTNDLLDFVRKQKWKNTPIGKLPLTCSLYPTTWIAGTPVIDNSLFKKVSVDSYDIIVPNSKFTGKTRKELTVIVPDCHWFRMWITEKDGVDLYRTNMKLEDTLDVFLSEGFYVNPHSNVAHPLPDIRELAQFRFRAERDDTRNMTLVEMAYGDVEGNPVYREYFQHPIMQKNAFKLHFIKAPGCKLGILSNDAEMADQVPEVANNMWDVSACTYSYFV